MNRPEEDLIRRPIKARNTAWAAGIARWLGRIGLRPNHISILSVLCAALAGLCLACVGSVNVQAGPVLWLAAAVCIQLRLLCNLFDGMVAVEGGFRTKSGEIYNDLPDRLSDPLILVPAGYCIAEYPFGVELGWLAALLAVLTAYVRVLGGSTGATQSFMGPMAKQHRMAVMTAACLLAAGESWWGWPPRAMVAALVLVIVGCVITMVRRVAAIVHELESR